MYLFLGLLTPNRYVVNVLVKLLVFEHDTILHRVLNYFKLKVVDITLR